MPPSQAASGHAPASPDGACGLDSNDPRLGTSAGQPWARDPTNHGPNHSAPHDAAPRSRSHRRSAQEPGGQPCTIWRAVRSRDPCLIHRAFTRGAGNLPGSPTSHVRPTRSSAPIRITDQPCSDVSCPRVGREVLQAELRQPRRLTRPPGHRLHRRPRCATAAGLPAAAGGALATTPDHAASRVEFVWTRQVWQAPAGRRCSAACGTRHFSAAGAPAAGSRGANRRLPCRAGPGGAEPHLRG
jgi:hypothetical protein